MQAVYTCLDGSRNFGDIDTLTVNEAYQQHTFVQAVGKQPSLYDPLSSQISEEHCCVASCRFVTTSFCDSLACG